MAANPGVANFYYINMHACTLCVCVSVMSEISGMGVRSTTLLAPTWRDSPGELQNQLLELKRRLVQEKNPLKLFRKGMKPCPSRFDSAILKKFVIFLKSVQLFCQ